MTRCGGGWRWVVAAAMAACAEVHAGTNLLANAGFESVEGEASDRAAGWGSYSTAERRPLVSGEGARSGSRCLLLEAQGVADAFQGLTQAVPVKPGTKYKMLAYAQMVASDPLDAGAYGQLVVEWKDADGQEISRVWSDNWGPKLSATRWEKVELKAVEAPAGAAQGLFGIHLFDGQGLGVGAVKVDDVEVRSQP